jgi:hypothetical protein
MKRNRPALLQSELPGWAEIYVPLIRQGYAAEEASKVACRQIFTQRRLTEIEEAQSRPVEEGPEWDRRRSDLEAELRRLR